MSFPTDIDPIPLFSADQTLILAKHYELHTGTFERIQAIQNFIGGPPGGAETGTIRERLISAEADITRHDQSIASAQVPVGTIVAYGGSTAPLGWALCDNSVHNSPALKAVLAQVLGNTPAADRTPDLRDKFILGAGGSLPRTGGRKEVTLNANQSGLRSHAHGAGSTPTYTDHIHHGVAGWQSSSPHGGGERYVHVHGAWTGGGGTHGHQVRVLEGNAKDATDGVGLDSSPQQGDWNPYGISGETVGGGEHNHPLGVDQRDTNHTHDVWTDGADGRYPQAINHSHGVTVNAVDAAGATEAVNLMNPYYAMVYIIRT